jgi:ElaB/YqjD/DUF883 family membrane-anchored ribosome-binding protein
MNTKSTNPKSDGNGQGDSSISAASVEVQSNESNVSKEFHNFLADIEDLIKGATKLTGEDLSRATEEIRVRVAAAKESVEAFGGEINQRAHKTASQTNEFVHKQPWEAIGAGAAVAFLLGFILARRS